MMQAQRKPRVGFLYLCILATVCAAWMGNPLPADSKPKPAGTIDSDHPAKMARGLEIFKKHIQPVLSKRCVRCHGGEKTESELDLTDREGLLRGGNRGPAVIVGDAKESLLREMAQFAISKASPYEG